MRGTAERARTRSPAAASRRRRGSPPSPPRRAGETSGPAPARPAPRGRAGNAPQSAEKRAGPGRVSGAAGGRGVAGGGGGRAEGAWGSASRGRAPLRPLLPSPSRARERRSAWPFRQGRKIDLLAVSSCRKMQRQAGGG